MLGSLALNGDALPKNPERQLAVRRQRRLGSGSCDNLTAAFQFHSAAKVHYLRAQAREGNPGIISSSYSDVFAINHDPAA
jgi:hypothetical protein